MSHNLTNDEHTYCESTPFLSKFKRRVPPSPFHSPVLCCSLEKLKRKIKKLWARDHAPLHAIRKKMAPAAPKQNKKEKTPKYYPADDIPVKPPSEREAASRGIAKLRKSIAPGTVLILLAGRFRGRRVIFLRQLPSGLLLCTGPYQVNGIPLRRVNQAYVIATSTKVDVSGVDSKKVSAPSRARSRRRAGGHALAGRFATGWAALTGRCPLPPLGKGAGRFRERMFGRDEVARCCRCRCMGYCLSRVPPPRPAQFEDSYFGKAKLSKAAGKKKGEEMFADATAKPETSAERKADQLAVDTKLMASMKNPLMAKYLKARFSLSKADKPHLMKF